MAKRPIFEEAAAPEAPRPAAPRAAIEAPTGARRAIRVWLGVLFLMVVAMIAVGGLTRLTDSGLSITEWRPVSGALPPMNDADWQAEFDLYQQIDQFHLQNATMTLSEFKAIYWWEWSHRQIGRLVGVVWALGFLFFWATPRIPPGWTGRLVVPGLLGGLQGAIGWWMVSSGITQGEGTTSVASYRLAVHLGLAFVILGVLTWQILLLGRPESQLLQARRGREARLFSLSTGLMHFAFLQILLGALVAGIDAGRGYTDWPLMAGGLFPPGMWDLSPVWRNLFENDGTVQFIHRLSGYLLAIFGIVVWARGRKSSYATTRTAFHTLLGALALQIALGIVTVMNGAPLALGLAHQLMAVILWVLILRARYLAQYPLGGTIRESRMTPFDNIVAHERTTWSLAQVMGRLGWDQETMMPRGAAEQRGEEMAALEEVLHARRTDPQLGDWLEAAEAPDATGEAILRHVRRAYRRNTRVPAALATELARVTSVAQGTWAEARARDDVAHFLPTLTRVIALKREEAAALAQNGDLYDALLNDYEPGITGEEIGAMFARMRTRLVALREKVLAAPAPAALKGEFGREGQLRLSRTLAEAFGYDFAKGRIDLAVHPFSSGSGADVRITTRVAETDPFNCFYSTIHEVGHACYEQNINEAYRFSPLGEGVSMGVHESQSRIYENQLGRSRAFTGWLHGQMGHEFGDLGMDAEGFYRAVNRVQPGYIRTEADEVHYNLHIMMRFDLERALISGDLQPADLEAAWNDRFLKDFGVAVDRPSHGMLQDVHWSVGLFGYFPTYSLGNVYAGCLMRALRHEIVGIDTALAEGRPTVATAWLREKLQQHGGLREPRETIAHACGFEPDEGPLLDYLEAKFGDIYGV